MNKLREETNRISPTYSSEAAQIRGCYSVRKNNLAVAVQFFHGTS